MHVETQVGKEHEIVQIGVVYPQTELSVDPATVRHYAREVEDLGYRHIVAYDHVVGADPAFHVGWEGRYDVDTRFHEPLVFYGFLAGITTLELITSIIIAPQRQTALLAKQAAEVDILTEGRFRLGIGIGWNEVEYQAMGQDFGTRGRRVEEQIGLLRRLWTEHSVTHDGEFDVLPGVGLAPLPIQQPIPIWLGGQSIPAYRRIGRLADGWFPQISPGDELADALRVIADAAIESHRDPHSIGMEGRLRAGAGDLGGLIDLARAWRDAGATHLDVNTMKTGLSGLTAHLEMLAKVADELRDLE